MTYPSVSLAYLRTITDCTGIIQHGTHSVPNRKLGYTTDDNARALIVATQHYERTGSRDDLDLVVTYLSFLHYARAADDRFKNFMTYQRVFLDDEGTEDCLGRSLWATGYASASSLPENVRIVAENLFETCSTWAGDLESPRARAYTLLGMAEHLKSKHRHPGLIEKISALADSLLAQLKVWGTKDWPWYEPYLTYGNAVLPLAMMVSGHATGNERYLAAAKQTMQFLTDTLVIDGRLEIIGNDGWYIRGQNRAWWDQQTIDAGYTVYMYVTAYEILGDEAYLDLARISYDWFFGNNRAGVWVYDPHTRGAYDAVTPRGCNLNQGAESTVSFLLAQMAMDKYIHPAPQG